MGGGAANQPFYKLAMGGLQNVKPGAAAWEKGLEKVLNDLNAPQAVKDHLLKPARGPNDISRGDMLVRVLRAAAHAQPAGVNVSFVEKQFAAPAQPDDIVTVRYQPGRQTSTGPPPEEEFSIEISFE